VLPPYWSIAVEIEMYFILWMVLARREAFAVIGFIAGVAYHAACLYAGLYWTMRYYPAPSAFLSFSLGALVYFALKRNKDLIGGKVAALAGGGWLVNLAAAGWLLPQSYVYGVGFYLDIALSVIVVAGLAGRQGSPRFARFDRMMGELAYPVFLLQWVVGLLVFETIMPGLRGWPLVLATMPALLASATVLAWAQRRYVEPLRDHLRMLPRSTIWPAFRALGPPTAPAASPARD
jgi:peptidoglycan/LPS O-acetylase OafA/YrhL